MMATTGKLTLVKMTFSNCRPPVPLTWIWHPSQRKSWLIWQCNINVSFMLHFYLSASLVLLLIKKYLIFTKKICVCCAVNENHMVICRKLMAICEKFDWMRVFMMLCGKLAVVVEKLHLYVGGTYDGLWETLQWGENTHGDMWNWSGMC